MKKYTFRQAVPVWEPGKDREMNYNLVFRTIVPKTDNTTIALTASNMYQMFVNGKMIAEGPARAGHGYYRVDETDISRYLTQDKNIVAIYVDSYYVDNYYLIKQPGFLCAEVIADGNVLAATGTSGFEAKYHSHRLRKVGRYSCQRTFSEVYAYDASYKAFETDVNCPFEPVCISPVEPKRFIQREVPYPCYDYYSVQQTVVKGSFTYSTQTPTDKQRKWITLTDTMTGGGFDISETECIVDDEIDKCICTATTHRAVPFDTEVINGGEWAIFDLEAEKTGFINLEISVDKKAEIILSYDEILTDGDVNIKRFNQSGGVVLFLEPGVYNFISNEPASMRYIKLANNSTGTATVTRLGITEYAFNYKPIPLGSPDPVLNHIYDAAVETFRQNTLDIYMDCPSRERAGWLCDSYFTSKVEHHLTGKSEVEKNFLENFVMTEDFTHIPDYMFAMCYPADFKRGTYIPNWAMWYVIELGEYFDRTGDREMVDCAKDKIMRLYRYFESLRNSDGLLENLESWVFLEWSRANDFTQNVNYPSNMLYAKMLRTMGSLYDEKYSAQAKEIEKTIIAQSYYNGFFHDHAIRGEDGKLTVIDADVTETCQYYAFFTEVATPKAFSGLWCIMLNDFGPDRAEEALWQEIYPANAFIGNYLRLCLLERYGETQKLIDNIKGYFSYMAEKTGTLWENTTPTASCNHGFASIATVWLDKYARK